MSIGVNFAPHVAHIGQPQCAKDCRSRLRNSRALWRPLRGTEQANKLGCLRPEISIFRALIIDGRYARPEYGQSHQLGVTSPIGESGLSHPASFQCLSVAL